MEIIGVDSFPRPVSQEDSQTQIDKILLKAATWGDYRPMMRMAAQDPRILLGTTPHGNNCLHIASIHGHLGFCVRMLAMKDDAYPGSNFRQALSSVNREEETPLVMAVTHGHADVAFFLLECCRGQELRHIIVQQDRKGFNALHHAIRTGQKSIALELIEAAPELSKAVTNDGVSPMFIAVMRDITQVSMRLLEIRYSAHGGTHGRHALHAAVRNGNQDITKKLLEERPHLATEADNDEITPIRMAVSYNKVAVLQVLLEHRSSLGYEIDKKHYPLLCSAAARGQVDVARVLLNHCPDALPVISSTNYYYDGTTCLHIAVKNGHLAFVEFIMRTPQLSNIVNMQDNNATTALHYAVELCDPRLVAALLSHKSIDITVLDNMGSTAASQLLHIADDDKTLDWKEVHVLMLKADPKDDDISLYNLRKAAKRRENIESKWRRKLQTQEYTRNTSLVAILTATITFTAGFTLPGGYSSAAGSEGLPIMSRKIAFQAFLVSDTLAMCSSFVVAFICLMGRWEDDKFTTYYISVTKKLTWFAYMTTITAFSTGLYTVLASRLHWLGIGICSLIAVLPILTMFIGQWPVLKFNFRLGQTWPSLKLKLQQIRRTWHAWTRKLCYHKGDNPNFGDMV